MTYTRFRKYITKRGKYRVFECATGAIYRRVSFNKWEVKTRIRPGMPPLPKWIAATADMSDALETFHILED